MLPNSIRPLILAASLLVAATAWADAAPAPQGVLNLAASASTEVTKDVLAITFSTTREGDAAAAVQSELKQALDAALTEAKKAARPGDVEVRTGDFSLTPRYTDKGVITGWRGRAELIVEGRDLQAISQLSGRISTLTIARVDSSLSRELRRKTEAEVSAEAIERFRTLAADYAGNFGYATYTIREVSVNTSEQGPPPPMPVMRMRAMSASAAEALPVEAGKGVVTVSVNGSVQMNR